jgi:hypothetical protein
MSTPTHTAVATTTTTQDMLRLHPTEYANFLKQKSELEPLLCSDLREKLKKRTSAVNALHAVLAKSPADEHANEQATLQVDAIDNEIRNLMKEKPDWDYYEVAEGDAELSDEDVAAKYAKVHHIHQHLVPAYREALKRMRMRSTDKGAHNDAARIMHRMNEFSIQEHGDLKKLLKSLHL